MGGGASGPAGSSDLTPPRRGAGLAPAPVLGHGLGLLSRKRRSVLCVSCCLTPGRAHRRLTGALTCTGSAPRAILLSPHTQLRLPQLTPVCHASVCPSLSDRTPSMIRTGNAPVTSLAVSLLERSSHWAMFMGSSLTSSCTRLLPAQGGCWGL